MSVLHGERCVVTGGAGFVGQNVVAALRERGALVCVLDRVPHPSGGLEQVIGDVADPATCARACVGAAAVFHCAGRLTLHEHAPPAVVAETYRTNVTGTATILAAAREAGVRRFVVTSSNHVVLGEAPIRDGDERLPYASGASDLYTRTKIEAERMVLAANDPQGLMTCALRPGGIYGPGDRQFVPRVVDAAALFGLRPCWAGRSSLIDLTHVESLALAHVLAAERLEPGGPVGGSAYFISDGDPIAVDDFNRLVLRALNLPALYLPLPTRLLRAAITTWEKVWARMGRGAPPFGACEIKTTAVAHHFSIAKAQAEIGYVPLYTTARGARHAAEVFRAGRA
ncbi:MAG: NAD-dependent epimerase/dehydratase family protein [Myxococcales bacterium]|nr:NAD-dependent epimerase/dehydratase family protein [Myxococcales bacterium]